MDWIQQLEAKLTAATTLLGKIDTLNDLAYEQSRGGDNDLAHDLAEKACTLSAQGEFALAPYLRGQLDSQVVKGRLLSKNGEHERALELWNQVYQQSQYDQQLQITHARVAICLGAFHLRKANYAEAQTYILESLEISRNLQSRQDEGYALATLANLYAHVDEDENAKRYYEESIALLHELGDFQNEAGFRCNYSMWLVGTEATPALEEAMKALELSCKYNYPTIEVFAIVSAGRALNMLERYGEAETYLKEGLMRDSALKDQWLLTALRLYLGKALLGCGKVEEALTELQLSLQIAEQSNSNWMQYQAHQFLAELYKGQKDFEQAFTHYRSYHQLFEQIRSAEAENRRKLQEVRYQTKVIRRESELQRQKTIELEEEVKRRQQIEEELQKAKLAAELAARSKADFLANMSHEIRTPLNGVIGAIEMLLETTLRNDQQELAQIVQKSGESLLNIINSILDFSKIEAGKLALERRPFNLHQCTEDALNVISTGADNKSLDLVIQIDHNVPSQVIGDTIRLRQVLVNLLSNAVKFTERGEVALSVSAKLLTHDTTDLIAPMLNGTLNGIFQQITHVLHFKIRDTGIGIAPERQSHLFSEFEQGDASISRRFGGTGLGLTISKRLVELMGGKIWLESEAGVGSIFQFTLPVKAVFAPLQTYQLRAQPNLYGHRVLIAEQNATIRNHLHRQLTNWGMEATSVGTNNELMDWLEKLEMPEILIIDMRLWNNGGTLLATCLEKEYIEQRVVLLTNTQMLDAAHRAESASILLRPVSIEALHRDLTQICGNFSQPTPNSPWSDTALVEIDRSMALSHPLRILLTEDNPVNQKVVLRMLERLGYEADTAMNGVDALAALHCQPYDVVLMDMHMPEMDGITATRFIHTEWDDDERPAVIALTADALEGDREYFLQQGLDYYLSKPVRLGELADILHKCRRLQTDATLMTFPMFTSETMVA